MDSDYDKKTFDDRIQTTLDAMEKTYNRFMKATRAWLPECFNEIARETSKAATHFSKEEQVEKAKAVKDALAALDYDEIATSTIGISRYWTHLPVAVREPGKNLEESLRLVVSKYLGPILNAQGLIAPGGKWTVRVGSIEYGRAVGMSEEMERSLSDYNGLKKNLADAEDKLSDLKKTDTDSEIDSIFDE